MSTRKKKATNVISLADYRKRRAVEAPTQESIIGMLRDLIVIWGKVAKKRGKRRSEVCQLAGTAMGQAVMAHAGDE
jgi:hypothetical protein